MYFLGMGQDCIHYNSNGTSTYLTNPKKGQMREYGPTSVVMEGSYPLANSISK